MKKGAKAPSLNCPTCGQNNIIQAKSGGDTDDVVHSSKKQPLQHHDAYECQSCGSQFDGIKKPLTKTVRDALPYGAFKRALPAVKPHPKAK